MNENIDMKAAAKAFSRLGASKGGKARAESLTKEERSEIARKAVEARWAKRRGPVDDGSPPEATHHGTLRIGETEIQCFVLENGTRIISTRGVMKALGRSWRGRKYSGTELPVFLEAKNLKPFISNDLTTVLSEVHFKTPGGIRGQGFRAELLPIICETYLAARDAGVLTGAQSPIAKQAEILMRGLARVGIIALVDEATGYQASRPQDALAKILEQFISKELAKWAKVFPDEFYENMFRLRGWEYRPSSSARPVHAAQLTNDLVYSRLAPGVLEELQEITPKDASGRRKHKYHQRLTADVGNPRLREHLASIITLMKATSRWSSFYAMLNRALPRYNATKELPFALDDDNAGE